MPTNIKFKAYCKNKEQIRKIILFNGAKYIGTDQQTDTYFTSKSGSLKLREGIIENKLIHCYKENKSGFKINKLSLYPITPNSSLKEILEKTIGTKSVVTKTREIFSIDNVNLHIDTVNGLGDFIEIETTDSNGSITNEKLLEQCNHYIKQLEINAKDLVSKSYSDLLQQNNLFNQILVDE